MIYTIHPTCGHESLTYRVLKLAKAHAQAHADRSGCPVHVTRGSNAQTFIVTQRPRIYGPYVPCCPDHLDAGRFDD